MRNPDRIDRMTELLRQTWHKYPDMRLGQLVTNAPYFDAEGNNTGHSIPAFLVEDGRMEEGLMGLLVRPDTYQTEGDKA